ncbi:MAG TPA: glycosyltransferase [Myxococcota bacterium]|nr:glycosyltransferase [Myxococcota bacterium]HQK50607.1 glycosyltransferase [Myxococcota bacterium]
MEGATTSPGAPEPEATDRASDHLPSDQGPGHRPALSLVIPCYNEAPRLPGTVQEVARFCDTWARPCEVVLVDDGSRDGTREAILQAASAHAFVRPVLLPRNRGKGAALRAGVATTTGSAVVFFDADLSYPIVTVEAALRELQAGADVVIGARDLGRAAGGDRPESLLRRVSHGVFAALVDHYLHLGIPDTQCGFKAFRGSVARALFASLTVDRFAFDVELLALARSWNLRIHRLPVTPVQRDGSSVRLVRDSLEMWRALVRIRRQVREGRYPAAPPLLED